VRALDERRVERDDVEESAETDLYSMRLEGPIGWVLGAEGEGMRRLTREAVREAVTAGAGLVILPELSTSGYVFESPAEARACAEPVGGPSLLGWAEEAARGDAVVIGGFCELGEDGALYNSAAVVDATGVLGVYRKIHLWDREQLFFEPGDACAPVLETRAGRIGVAVCYDLNFPEIARGLALGGAELIALPANFPRFPRPEGRPMEVTLAMATISNPSLAPARCSAYTSWRYGE
jgi:predicted amidohydrolase